MRINRGVVRAIRRRQTEMSVRTDTSVLTRGVFVTTKGTPIKGLAGCFQQINRFDNFLGDELKQLTEGERLEASTILWTEHKVQRGSNTPVAGTTKKADIVTDINDGVTYKVLAVRNKKYGKFYRAVLSEIAE